MLVPSFVPCLTSGDDARPRRKSTWRRLCGVRDVSGRCRRVTSMWNVADLVVAQCVAEPARRPRERVRKAWRLRVGETSGDGQIPPTERDRRPGNASDALVWGRLATCRGPAPGSNALSTSGRPGVVLIAVSATFAQSTRTTRLGSRLATFRAWCSCASPPTGYALSCPCASLDAPSVIGSRQRLSDRPLGVLAPTCRPRGNADSRCRISTARSKWRGGAWTADTPRTHGHSTGITYRLTVYSRRPASPA